MKSLHDIYDEIQLGERGDMLSRVVHRLTSAIGALRHRLPASEPTNDEFIAALIPGHFMSMHEFLEEHATRPAPWSDIDKDAIPDSVVHAAEQAVQKHFCCLGTTFHFNDDIDWHRAALADKSWPRLHWSEISLGATAQLGDIKPCWTLNQHMHFVSLGLAWRRTGDEKYALAFTQMINSWCDQNTPETGIHYISGYGIGLRCLSWIIADRLFQGAQSYDSGTQARLHRNLLAQARHMAEYLTGRGRTGFGHMPACEAALLAYITLMNPEWRDGRKWQTRALNQLWPAFDDRIYPDGMHFECSFGYQLQVAECLLLLLSEMRRQKRPIPAKVYTMLEKMATVLRTARQPDNELPNINDNDGGTVVPLPLSTAERLEGLMAAMAVLYDRPDFKSSVGGGTFPLYARLLLGAKGAEDYRLVACYPEDFPRLTYLVHSRVAMIRRDKDFLLFKNNPDPFPQSGHNHADLLSVLLYLDGTPVLCDSGTYRFADAKGYRNAMRATEAHNTLCIDGHGQSDPRRLFDWSHPTAAGETYAQAFDDVIVLDGRHDSFHVQGVTHRRVLLWLKREEALLVIDRVDGTETHAMDQFWHFAPGMRAADAGENRFSLSTQTGDQLAEIQFFRNDERDTLEIIAASDINKNCYRSRRYGELEPATALLHRWTSTLAPGNASHRAVLFSKKPMAAEFSDVRHAEFRFNEWNIDLNQTPAAVTRAFDTGR